jgi:membrane-associated phospholipid phosphatase
MLWDLIPWGYRALLDLEAIRSGGLTLSMSVVTDLGSNLSYLVILSLVYWCIDKSVGQGLAYASLFSATLNIWLKELWRIPRPGDAALEEVLQQADIEGRLTPLREPTQPSFPSGHAQGAAVTWGYLAYRAATGPCRVRWAWFVAVPLVALIAFSRLYLGVHFPQDVVAGLAVGAAFLALWLWAEPCVRPRLATLSLGWQYALAVIAPLAMLAVLADHDTTAAMGAAMGLGVGYVLESRTLRFTVSGGVRIRVLRGALGLALMIAAYLGLSALFGLVQVAGIAEVVGRVLRYALLGFAGAWGVPWLFVRTGLAEQSEDVDERTSAILPG